MRSGFLKTFSDCPTNKLPCFSSTYGLVTVRYPPGAKGNGEATEFI